MPFTLADAVSKAVLRYLDETWERQKSANHLELVQALSISCASEWFRAGEPDYSKRLQELAMVSPLDHVSLSIAGVLQSGSYWEAEAVLNSSGCQVPKAHKPFLHLAVSVHQLLDSEADGTRSMKVPQLTSTSVLQSALLAIKLLACTSCTEGSATAERQQDAQDITVDFVGSFAQHITASSWTDDSVASDLALWAVRCSLVFLRQAITDKEQCRYCQQASSAAYGSIQVLKSLLRPSTTVAARVNAALHDSGKTV